MRSASRVVERIFSACWVVERVVRAVDRSFSNLVCLFWRSLYSAQGVVVRAVVLGRGWLRGVFVDEGLGVRGEVVGLAVILVGSLNGSSFAGEDVGVGRFVAAERVGLRGVLKGDLKGWESVWVAWSRRRRLEGRSGDILEAGGEGSIDWVYEVLCLCGWRLRTTGRAYNKSWHRTMGCRFGPLTSLTLEDENTVKLVLRSSSRSHTGRGTLPRRLERLVQPNDQYIALDEKM